MLTKAEIEELKRIDCRKIASALPLSLSGSHCGPCPVCGGTDRFNVTEHSFWCRAGEGHCGAKGDGIKLVQLVKDLSFRAACEWLKENQALTPAPPAPQRQPTQRPQPDAWRGAEWQRDAGAAVAHAHAQLASGLGYLSGRGFTVATLNAYNVGYTSAAWYSNQSPALPAIVIPWYDGATLTCVRNRFIEPPDPKDRYRLGKFAPRRKEGSAGEALLFQSPPRQSDTLVIVEGDFNNMSIYQASTFYPVSMGSNSFPPATLTALAELAPGFARILVWCDDAATAQKIEAALNHPQVILYRSPVIDGVKLDANELLQRGILADLLGALLPSPAVEAPVIVAPSAPAAWRRDVLDIDLWRKEVTAAKRSERDDLRSAGQRLERWLCGADLELASLMAACSAVFPPLMYKLGKESRP